MTQTHTETQSIESREKGAHKHNGPLNEWERERMGERERIFERDKAMNPHLLRLTHTHLNSHGPSLSLTCISPSQRKGAKVSLLGVMVLKKSSPQQGMCEAPLVFNGEGERETPSWFLALCSPSKTWTHGGMPIRINREQGVSYLYSKRERVCLGPSETHYHCVCVCVSIMFARPKSSETCLHTSPHHLGEIEWGDGWREAKDQQ